MSKLCLVSILFLSIGCFNSDNPFSYKRLNDGIEVDAPDSWRWVRDGLQEESFLLLSGVPDALKKGGLPSDTLDVWKYETEIEGAYHLFKFDKSGFLLGCNWYDGLLADDSLDKPEVLIDKVLAIDYPRCIPILWKGESRNGFQVEVDIKYLDSWTNAANYFTKNHKIVHQNTGANPGRWRVRKLSFSGYGPWSDYVEFKCTQ